MYSRGDKWVHASVIAWVEFKLAYYDIAVPYFKQITDSGILVRVFANSPEDLGLIPSRLNKWYLILPCLTFSMKR